MDESIISTKSADKVMQDLRTLVQDAQELLQSGMGNLRARAHVGTQRAEDLLHQRPYQSLGVAFGAGLAAGLLLAGLFSQGSHDDY